MKTFKEFISVLNQADLDRESSTINQNTRNAPVKRQQPAFQQSQSEPQKPSGVPIPGTSRAFKAVKTVGQAAVGSILK